MREIKFKVFKFEELSDEAKEKALDNNRNVVVEWGDWWEFVYESAKENGVTIKSFDLYRRDIDVDVDFDIDREAAIEEIKDREEFGTSLLALVDDDDYETAAEYLIDEYLEEYEEEKLKELIEEAKDHWLKALDQEYEWLTSDEGVSDMLINNEYEFTEDGETYR